MINSKAYQTGKADFLEGKERVVPLEVFFSDIVRDGERACKIAQDDWYRGWDDANDETTASDNIETLDDLISRLQLVREKASKNLPVIISVLQETIGNPNGIYYEDRKISRDIVIVGKAEENFVELYV